MKKLKVKIKKHVKFAEVPKYQTSGSSGMDISSAEYKVIKPGCVGLVSTGLSVQVPKGYEMQVRPRSGLALKKSISVINSPGTVDSDYTGIVGVILVNHGGDEFVIHEGDRIAQIVFCPVAQANLVEVDSLDDTDRGDGGFGSTGV